MAGSYSTDRFTYHKPTKTFVAEASEIEVGRLYPDESAYGVHLVSHVTGEIVDMVYADRKIDKEGDTTSWIFVPTSKEHDFKLEIFND